MRFGRNDAVEHSVVTRGDERLSFVTHSYDRNVLVTSTLRLVTVSYDSELRLRFVTQVTIRNVHITTRNLSYES